jgi:F-type H+-transporting ATPase subunit gamma
MPSLQDLRRRVRAVNSTRQITRAMKMVSSARLRRAQDRVVAARPYTNKMLEIFRGLTRRAPDFKHPLLTGREREEGESGRERVLLLLITGDRGLSGAFNANLIKAAQEFLRTHGKDEVEMVIVGRKGHDFFRRRGAVIRRQFVGLTASGQISFAEAQGISQGLIADFTAEENPVDRVHIIYNEFKSAIQQRLVVEQVLPVEVSPTGAEAETLTEYLYEQPPDEIFGILLPKLVEAQIHRALLESIAAEMGARMTAMEAATKNADEVIDRLTLTMNRVRQASITREIIEIVSGAGAL